MPPIIEMDDVIETCYKCNEKDKIIHELKKIIQKHEETNKFLSVRNIQKDKRVLIVHAVLQTLMALSSAVANVAFYVET